jgi:hypothetical protein
VFVGEVQIDAPGMLGDADVNRALWRIELGTRLEQIDSRPDRFGAAAPPVSS